MRTVGAGMLVLAVTVAAPALSAAQDPGVPAEPAPVIPTPPTPPPEPEPPADGDAGEAEQEAGSEEQVANQAAATATAPAPDAAPEKRAKASASKTISVGDNFYRPATISISVGDTVTWTNDGAAQHSATADDGSFDTGIFNSGQSRSETFTSAGNIPYFCTVHGQAQSGTIKVLAASGGGGGGGSSSSGSEAAAVASPGAAGSSTSLPATGFAAIGLAVIGMALLAGGSLIRHRELARDAGAGAAGARASSRCRFPAL